MRKDLSVKKATFDHTLCINYEYAFRARPSRCLMAIAKPFCFFAYFLIQLVEIPNATRETVTTVQLASKAIRVQKKPMVICCTGNLNLGLEHTVQH